MTTHVLGDTQVLTGRSLRHILRSPDTIITTAVMPIAMLLMFVYVFGGAIDTGPGSGPYVNYLLPGILLITIASGIFQFNLALFIALCVLTRGARFFLVAFVLKRWGPPMLAIVEKRLALFTVLFLALLVGAFFMVKLIGH